MTTPAQIAANRRNARRSTGPTTRQGKATAAQNARRHGLLAQVVTLPDEDPARFTTFHERMTTELAPVGPLEEFLVERIVAAAWRLGRVVRLEAGVLAVRTQEAETARTTTDRHTPRPSSRPGPLGTVTARPSAEVKTASVGPVEVMDSSKKFDSPTKSATNSDFGVS